MTASSVLALLRSEPSEPACQTVREKWRGRSKILISLEPPAPDVPVIHRETAWRSPDILKSTAPPEARLVVSRWSGRCPCEHSCEIAGDFHVVGIALQATEFTLWLGTRSFPALRIAPGMMQITGPAVTARIAHAQPYDALHLFVPHTLLLECFEWGHGRRPASGVVLRDPQFAQDAVLQTMSGTLLSMDDADDPYSGLRADFLNLAIVSRLLGLYGESGALPARKTSPLPKWRLKRVVEFIDAHLGSPVTLADLSRAAGLSRMHFAVQFRAATGYRPHEYVLRRRVERAQTLLAARDEPIAELALSVGFSSQAHFTTVFKRFSGLTPARWRQRALSG